MDDLISRQQAIALADSLKDDLPDDERIADAVMAHNEGIMEYQTKLSLLPSEQPERKKGEWIYNSPVTMKCDQCGLVIKDWDWHRFKFCPNCDCDMRGEQHINMQPTIEPSTNCSEFPNNSDTVSRQAAIDIVDDVRDCISVEGYWAIVERIGKLPTIQPEPQWIPVSERLPETGGKSFFDGMVLTTLKDRETGDLYVLNDKYCGDGNWLMCLPDDSTDVIAWMPLPAPYQKGEHHA